MKFNKHIIGAALAAAMAVGATAPAQASWEDVKSRADFADSIVDDLESDDAAAVKGTKIAGRVAKKGVEKAADRIDGKMAERYGKKIVKKLPVVKTAFRVSDIGTALTSENPLRNTAKAAGHLAISVATDACTGAAVATGGLATAACIAGGEGLSAGLDHLVPDKKPTLGPATLEKTDEIADADKAEFTPAISSELDNLLSGFESEIGGQTSSEISDWHRQEKRKQEQEEAARLAQEQRERYEAELAAQQRAAAQQQPQQSGPGSFLDTLNAVSQGLNAQQNMFDALEAIENSDSPTSVLDSLNVVTRGLNAQQNMINAIEGNQGGGSPTSAPGGSGGVEVDCNTLSHIKNWDEMTRDAASSEDPDTQGLAKDLRRYRPC